MTAAINALIQKYAADGLTAALSWLGSSELAPALVVAAAGFALLGTCRPVLLRTSASTPRVPRLSLDPRQVQRI
jgi:hypothetical protein